MRPSSRIHWFQRLLRTINEEGDVWDAANEVIAPCFGIG
jgi:hypothetical protein